MADEPWADFQEQGTTTDTLPWEDFTESEAPQPSFLDRIKQGALAGGEAAGQGAVSTDPGQLALTPIAHSVTGREMADAMDTIKQAVLSTAPGHTKSFMERLGEMPVREPTTAEQIAAGVQNVAAEQLTSPLALAFPVASKALPPSAVKAIGALFGTQAAMQVPEAARRAGEASVTGTPFEKTVAYGGLGATLALPPLAALDVVRGRATPEREVSDAREDRTTEEIHGDVRSQPVEGQGKVPVEEGGEGVQPKTSQAEVALKGPSFDEMVKRIESDQPLGTQTYQGELQRTGGITGFAYDLGLKARTPEDVQLLKDLTAKWSAKSEELRQQLREGKATMEEASAAVYKTQTANEAHQAATGVKADTGEVMHSALKSLGESIPGFKPKFPHENYTKFVGETKAAPEAQVKAQQETDRAPAYSLGIAAPGTQQAQRLIGAFTTAIKESPQWARDVWNSFSLKSAPKMTESKREVGESAVRYAASPLVGRTKGQIFADRVLQGVDSDKFGTAITEDNLRSLKDVADDPNSVATMIGRPGSPFKTEAEYQAFLADPATHAAIERGKQMWAEQKDPLFRQANDLDPDLPLQTRGKQTGLRVNLKALREGEKGVKPVGREGFKQLATLKRSDPFGRTATGTGQAYEGNYHEIMAHGFERELPVAAQHNFIKELIDNGDAVVKDKSFIEDLKLKGEETKGYLLTLKPWTGKFLHVRSRLIPEFEGVSNLRPSNRVPIISAANDFLTRQSVAGLAEGTTHASNLMSAVFTGPGPTANPLINALVKSLGRADLLYSIPKIIIKGFSNQRERMLELTEIGAAKEPYAGIISKRILNPIDQGARIVLDDIYKAMAEKGIVEKSETARREFINQVGQYNKRLQPALTKLIRETVNPFQTATQTFVAQGLRRMAMSPGVAATSNARALALKADIAAGWLGAIALITTLNLITSGKAGGPAGTPLGAVGWIGDDRKVKSFNILRLLGYERGLRATGLGPFLEAKQRGLSTQQAMQAAGQSITSTGLGMVMGPGARFATVAATGLRPTQPWVKEARTVPPSDSLNPLKTQIAENIKTAVIEANPIISTVAEIRKGVEEGDKPVEIARKALEKQASRYTPRSGMTEQMATKLPKIVDTRQLRDYADDLAKETRRLPREKRWVFLMKRLREDDLTPAQRKQALDQVKRRGTLKYE